MDTHAEQLKKTFDKFFELSQVVTDDLTEAILQRNKNDSQYLRRAFFRHFFVWVELHVHLLKQVVLTFHTTVRPVLSPKELAVVCEEQYQLNKAGAVTVQRKFLPLAQNLRFAFMVYAKTFLSDFRLDVAGEGWRAFKQAVVVRNRITHPKVSDLLTISDIDLLVGDEAYRWLKKAVVELFGSETLFLI